ncbi:MAG: hypothetical protein ACI97P_002968, partial [Arcticibacterium sp.]
FIITCFSSLAIKASAFIEVYSLTEHFEIFLFYYPVSVFLFQTLGIKPIADNHHLPRLKIFYRNSKNIFFWPR